MRKCTDFRLPFYTFLMPTSHTGRIMILEPYTLDSANQTRVDSG